MDIWIQMDGALQGAFRVGYTTGDIFRFLQKVSRGIFGYFTEYVVSVDGIASGV